MPVEASFAISARSDARDFLVEAEEPLAGLHLRAGGELPGPIITPALLELVRKARSHNLKLARAIEAHDKEERITAWAEVEPGESGCTIRLANWSAARQDERAQDIAARRARALVGQVAAFTARLDPDQRVMTAHGNAPDLAELESRMLSEPGRIWSDFVEIAGETEERPLHSRLLDGLGVRVEDSPRDWTAFLLPLGTANPANAGFELFLVPEGPLSPEGKATAPAQDGTGPALSSEIAPVLRQPISRIIANAETIRSQLAGPLAEEYSNYATDIASAGEHLLALIDDLTALELVESQDFSPTPEQIDLADLARRARGMLGGRARERGIEVHAPGEDERVPAIGELRRVLQILLNLLGNAIRYSPEGAQVWLRVERQGDRARVSVADQGAGIDPREQERAFQKFERLGRSGDSGSGLGLYISRRLAEAMGGSLTVKSAKGEGAVFTLDLPADPEAD